MTKRSREEASNHPLARRQPRQKNPAKPPPSKRCGEPSVGGGATGKPSGQVGKGKVPGTDVNSIAGDSLHPQAAAGDAPVAAESPRWWQLWLGRGGGAVVDYEELLCGWFPFVDEDFTSDGEKAGWFSTREQEDDLYDDIWQLKHLDEIPSGSR